MKTRTYLLALVVLTLLSLVVLAAVPAQAEDEPAPGVARVSLIHGDVSAMRGDSGDWVATTVNAPLVRGDKITTGERSRAEIQLDYANVLRLGEKTEVKIADLTRTRIQLQVAQGLVTLSVFKGTEADVEVDTPNMAVRPLEEGLYRVEVMSPAETRLIVRKGEAEVATPEGSTRVGENKVIFVQGTDNPEYQIARAPGRDDWDNWNRERDAAIREAKSWKYANHYYTGAQDLDRYGRWVYVPDYDWVWTPYVSAGWVPYAYGRWGWYPYWGWTWISYEPWGWAPYHYGRWFYWNSSWCWWPGYRYYGYYPTWAPAYVSFIGFGFGHHRFSFGFGYGFNSIGWLPLGPYDHFNPWWGRGNRFNVVNITNVTNITNINNTNVGDIRVRRVGQGIGGSNLQAALTNANVRRAITTVSTDDFVRGRIPGNRPAIDAATLRQAQVVQGTLPAVPTRESLRPVDRPVNTAVTSRASGAQSFFSRQQPPAGPRPFNERATEVRQMMEQHNPLETGRGATPAGTGAAPATAANANRLGQDGSRGAFRSLPGAANTPGEPGNASNAWNSRERGLARAGGTSGPANAAGPSSAAATAPAGTAPGTGAQAGLRSGWESFAGRGASGHAGFSGEATHPATGTQLAQRSETASAQSSTPAAPSPQPARRGWERFGTGQARPGSAGSTATPGTPPTAPPTVTAAPRIQGTPSSNAGERPGWQRFGTGNSRQPWPAAVNAPSAPQNGSPAGLSARPESAASPPPQERGGWRRFETPSRPAPQGGVSGLGRAAQGGDEPAGQSRRFSTRSPNPPAERGGSIFSRERPATSAPSQERSGWSRFERSERAAPRSSERPPLDIRKPIVTERPAPQTDFSSGGGRSWSFPSGGNRSFDRGGSGSWSAPSGGNRSWSTPGGGGRSAPSFPSRSMGSMGGGGGSRSGGFSGGSRGGGGGSAPSRGHSGSFSRGRR
jgi:hypothetical protein